MNKILLSVVLLMAQVASVFAAALDANAPSHSGRVSEGEAGFLSRRAEAFEALRGKPFVQGYVSPNKAYVRPQSYAYMDFTFRCLWNNEQHEAVNEAVALFVSLYDAEKTRDNGCLDWVADELFAIIERFGSRGIVAPGRLSDVSEKRLLDLLWRYAKKESRLEFTDLVETENTWNFKGTENLNAQKLYVIWHCAQTFKNHPEYSGMKYDDGNSPATHFLAANGYIKQWIRERARKGMFIEFACEGYNAVTIKGIYNCFDFAEDPELKELSRMYLDLFWVMWGQEQLNGVRGGAKARTYQGPESILAYSDAVVDVGGATRISGSISAMRKAFWFYTGLTSPELPSHNVFTYIASSYRPSPVVLDIMTDHEGRGEYEVVERMLGIGRYYPRHMIDLKASFTRYTYCTPDFVLGAYHCKATPQWNWSMISSQNRWIGAIFSEAPNSRVFFQCGIRDGGRNYNQYWAVQSRGAVIVQKLDGAGSESTRFSKYAEEMKVWVGSEGRSGLLERDGWVFVTYGNSYAAIRIAEGGYTWVDDADKAFPGRWMVLNSEYSPIVMEVARKRDFNSYEEFQNRILALPLLLEGKVLSYRSLYDDNLTFYSDFSRIPEINGKPVELHPRDLVTSPFIRSAFNSGVYTISKGDRSLTLDFNGSGVPSPGEK